MVGIRFLLVYLSIFMIGYTPLYALRPYERAGEEYAEEEGEAVEGGQGPATPVDVEKFNISEKVKAEREENKRKLHPFVYPGDAKDDEFFKQKTSYSPEKEVSKGAVSSAAAVSPSRRKPHVLFSAIILLGFLYSYFFIRPKPQKNKKK